MKKVLCFLLALTMLAGLCAFASAEEAPAPGNKGIERVSISVSDLESTANFFVEHMELTKVGEGTLSAEEVKGLYGMDATAKYVLVKNDLQTTVLELLEFDPKPTKTSREGYNAWDFGYFDVAFRCQDNEAAFEKFTGLGYDFYCPPYKYVTSWSNAEVLEAVMKGPDGIPLALMGKTASTPEFEGLFRNFPDVVLVAEDVDECDHFYVDTLGLTKAFDMVLDDGLVDPIFGLEEGVHSRIVMYMGSGATPIVEILEFSKKGVSMTADGASVPANAGTFATCYEVENLDEALAAMNTNGFATTSEIVEYELATIGKIRAAIVSGPSQAMFEIYELVK